LREDLTLHCLRLDMSFHNQNTPGQLIERIDGDVANLANFFSDFVFRIVGSLILLFGVLGLLYWEDWHIGAALTVYAIIGMACLFKMRSIAVPQWKAARQASSDLFGFLEEQLSGTEDLRSSGATGYALQQFYKHAGNRLKQERIAGLKSIWLRNTNAFVNVLGYIISLISCFYLFNDGAITIGKIYLVIAYTGMLSGPLRRLTRQMEDLQKASASLSRIEELQLLATRVHDGPGYPLPSGPIAIEFRELTFGYKEDEPVLHDLSFRLESGRILGLLGRTGSGKTTVARLLFRLYDPQSGEIHIGGTDIRQAKIAALRDQVGMVTQSVQLFRATIRDNLTFFNPEVADDHILHVIEDIGLLPWYEQQPQGLDTQLQSGGQGLSAGQAQLLTFVRVFLKAPGLVVLDEATSRLDPATEGMIERAIDKLLARCTAIIIAHRLATVRRADDILILDEGRVHEHGPRRDLEKDPNSRFSELLRTGLTEVLS
jgi:ATP-binding cassette subfamily B protein